MARLAKNPFCGLWLVFLTALQTASTARDFDETLSEICKRSKCVPYKIVRQTKKYELRQYNARQCIETKTTSTELAKSILYSKVLLYVESLQTVGSRFEPHYLPMMTQISNDAGKTTSAMHVYLHDATYPKPSSYDVILKTCPLLRVYIRCFSGDAVQENLETLKQDVGFGNYNDTFYILFDFNVHIFKEVGVVAI